MDKKKLKIIVVFLVFGLIMSAFPVGADTMEEITHWVNGKESPKPQVMISSYTVNPEILMPGDEAIVVVTLENTQDDTIKNWVRDLRYEGYEGEEDPGKTIIDADTTITLSMDAYIDEAYIDSREIKVYDRYNNVGSIGPGKELDLAFKIKVPSKEGIYIANFFADIEDPEGNRCRSIKHPIPIIVSSTVELIPLSTQLSIQETGLIKIEVANTGLGGANTISVTSESKGLLLEPENMYIGGLGAGESTNIEFKVENVIDYDNQVATFKANYKNGINRHESLPIDVSTNYEQPEPSPRSLELTEILEEETIYGTNDTDSQPTKSIIGRILAFLGFFGGGVLVLPINVSDKSVFRSKRGSKTKYAR